jgi:hypothetical protein
MAPEEIRKIAAAGYADEQVLRDWFPGDAPLPANGERR